MSHLLYLHSFAVDRFVSVFGAGKKDYVDPLLHTVSPQAMKATTPGRAREIVTNAIMKGLDGKALPDGEQSILDLVVYEALRSKKFGIPSTALSPMGASGPLFDAYEPYFDDAGATKLFQVLQRGRNYETAFILLSPEDVALAAKLLKKVAEHGEDDGDDFAEAFTQELVEPFEAASKKGRAVFGRWG